jgi:hypothetical protein
MLVLRHQSHQDYLEGITGQLWHEENYIVSDSLPVGRIYKTGLPPDEIWVWCVLARPIHDSIQSYGCADTLDEAKMRFSAAWDAVQWQISKARR